jgi:hypothetical protein
MEMRWLIGWRCSGSLAGDGIAHWIAMYSVVAAYTEMWRLK